MAYRGVPAVTVKRLPVYLRTLQELVEEGVQHVTSRELAVRTQYNDDQIRKDLAYFGTFGTKGLGYDTAVLCDEIRRALGLDRRPRAALVGAGKLGTALAYHFLSRSGDVMLTAIFDHDPRKAGRRIGRLQVRPVHDLPQVVHEQGIRLAVVAVPGSQAQRVVDQLQAAGVEGILDFSGSKLRVAQGCHLEPIDLTAHLQSLSYYTRGPWKQEEPWTMDEGLGVCESG